MKNKKRDTEDKRNDSEMVNERRKFLFKIAKATAYSFPLIYLSKIDSVLAEVKSTERVLKTKDLSTPTSPSSPPKVDLVREIQPIPQRRPGPISQVPSSPDGTAASSCTCACKGNCMDNSEYYSNSAENHATLSSVNHG